MFYFLNCPVLINDSMNVKSENIKFMSMTTNTENKNNILIDKITENEQLIISQMKLLAKPPGWGSVGRASDRHIAHTGSTPQCGKGFFSQSQLSVQTLLHVSVHPCVQLHAFTSGRTLKIL